MYVKDILCEISKGNFEIPHKISEPYIEKFHFLYKIEILRALRFKRSEVFLKRPLVCYQLFHHFMQYSGGSVHYSDVIMDAIASQITSLTIVYSTVYSGSDQRKHQSSASLAFVRGIRRWPVNSSHKGPVMRKKVPIWWRHHAMQFSCAVMAFITEIFHTCSLRNGYQWNWNQNMNIFSQENAFQNVVCKIWPNLTAAAMC